jgi:hypothetical protein
MRFENLNPSSIIDGMLIRRFALGLVFIVLALTGTAGAAMEFMVHEAEHCPTCETKACPASKSSINHHSVSDRKLCSARCIGRKAQTKTAIYSTPRRLRHPLDSSIQILLI